MRLIGRAAFLSLWCFVFSLPWDVLTSLPMLGSIPRLFGLVASAVGIVYVLARSRIRPLSSFHVFALLFVLWAGMSSFWSVDPETTRTRFLTYLQLFVLVWLIWEIAWSPERQRGLLQAYVLGVCVAAFATVYNYFLGTPWREPLQEAEAARFVALNQDPNYLGLTLVLGLPIAWYLSLSHPHGRWWRVWQFYVPLGVTATLLTGSRAAALAALVALMIIPLTLGRVRLRTKIALCVLAVGSLVLAISFVPEASLERIRSTRADIEAGYFGGRAAIWRAGLEVAGEHPLVGVGAGGFGAAIAPALAQREWGSHQTYLEILVEQGIIGLFLLLAMLAAVIKRFRHLPRLQRRFSIVLLATLMLGSMSLHLGNRKQFWFVLGVLAVQVAQRPARETTFSRPQPPVYV